MSDKAFKPLKAEDFKLSLDELTELVEGAQKYFPPVEDPADAETAPLTPPATDTPV